LTAAGGGDGQDGADSEALMGCSKGVDGTHVGGIVVGGINTGTARHQGNGSPTDTIFLDRQVGGIKVRGIAYGYGQHCSSPAIEIGGMRDNSQCGAAGTRTDSHRHTGSETGVVPGSVGGDGI